MEQVRKIVTMSFLLIGCLIYSQTTTTESKSCGSCGKAVSIYSKIGDTCPHCGVRWGDENTTTSTSTKRTYDLPNLSFPNKTNSNSYPSTNNNVEKEKPNPFSNSSKDYTINWLNEKLNTYKQDYVSCSTGIGTYNCLKYKDYDFKFQNGYFVVKYNYKENDIVNYIPLYDINYAYGKNFSDNFSISTNSKTIISINKTTNKKEYDNYIQIGFEGSRENGLIDKIIQAFDRLASVSSKPSSEDLPSYKTNLDVNRPTSYETKEWLLSKFKKYGDNSNYYSITQNNLIIKTSSNPDIAITYTIPLCDCKIYESSRSSYDKYIRLSGSERIKIDRNWKGFPHYETGFDFKFNFNSEDNLIDRMQKSLDNLSFYCTGKSKVNEKF